MEELFGIKILKTPLAKIVLSNSWRLSGRLGGERKNFVQKDAIYFSIDQKQKY